jgi:hypothetical protein
MTERVTMTLEKTAKSLSIASTVLGFGMATVKWYGDRKKHADHAGPHSQNCVCYAACWICLYNTARGN